MWLQNMSWENNWYEMLRKNTSGCDDSDASEISVERTLQKNILSG